MSTRAVVPMKPAAAKAHGSLLQRKCACGALTGHENECEDCKKKKLQRRAIDHGPGTAPPIVHEVLRSPGQPLDKQTRSYFEPRFGHDFSKVRVHTDAQAHESARAVNALAYTVGNNLVFSAGHFTPSTKPGQRLLAHELTHVIQQSRSGAAAVQRKLEIGPANDSLEQEADRFAEQIMGESRVKLGWRLTTSTGKTSSQLQRQYSPSPPPVEQYETGNLIHPRPGAARTAEFSDRLIEEAQNQPDHNKGDRLGKVSIPSDVPPEEVPEVKFFVFQYFKAVGTRNAEVDVIIPMPGKTKNVFYTLRFRPNNNVDVERIGEQGKNAKAGEVDPNKLDIAKSPEFAAQSKDPSRFTGWLKKRYPKVSVSGKTVEELRQNINKEAETNSGKPGWFENYNIKILDAKQAERRLLTVHRFEKPQVKDMKTFLPEELRMLEAVLQTMSSKILALLQKVHITRQHIRIKKVGNRFEEDSWLHGLTVHGGENNTIIIFDKYRYQDDSLFLGGKEGVLPRSASVYAHELGHVVSNEKIKNLFNTFVKANCIRPITRYAETGMGHSSPKEEFIAEAFALYQTDPEWMRNNSPRLYEWFHTLAQTGHPPLEPRPKSATGHLQRTPGFGPGGAITLTEFEAGSAMLKPIHYQELREYKKHMQKLLAGNLGAFITIVGHEDAPTCPATLGQKRADAVKVGLAGGDSALPASILHPFKSPDASDERGQVDIYADSGGGLNIFNFGTSSGSPSRTTQTNPLGGITPPRSIGRSFDPTTRQWSDEK